MSGQVDYAAIITLVANGWLVIRWIGHFLIGAILFTPLLVGLYYILKAIFAALGLMRPI